MVIVKRLMSSFTRNSGNTQDPLVFAHQFSKIKILRTTSISDLSGHARPDSQCTVFEGK